MTSTATKLNLMIAQETLIMILLKEGKTPIEVASYLSGCDVDFITEIKEMEGL